MRVEMSEQYQVPCVILDGDEPFEDVINAALDAEAFLIPPGEDEDHFVIQFPDRPMELYTEEALRRSLDNRPLDEDSDTENLL